MLDIISINPLKTHQVFIYNADPDESDTMFQFNSKKLVDKSTSVSLAALGMISHKKSPITIFGHKHKSQRFH